MFRHPPVMVPQVIAAALQGDRWRSAQSKAERIALDAVQRGLIPADDRLRQALGLPSTENASRTATEEIQPNTEVDKKSEPYALVPLRAPDDVLSLYHKPTDAVSHVLQEQRPRLVTYDVLDMTLGGGHHSAALLQQGAPYTRVVALDCDFAVRDTTANAMKETFGVERFQFFNHRMSEAQTLFGDHAFDCVLLDPGPNQDQLDDLARGFTVDTDDDIDVDMRYGPHFASNALQWLNEATRDEIANTLEYFADVPRRQGYKFANALARERPLQGSGALRSAVFSVAHEFSSEPWEAHVTELYGAQRPKRPLSAKILLGIRCAVNHERFELLNGLRSSLELLRPEGRVIVMTREKWEHELVKWFTEEHPYALLLGESTIERDEAAETRQPHTTKMWQLTRVRGTSFDIKNAARGGLSVAERKEEEFRWLMSGSDFGQQRGFPAARFTGSGTRLSAKDREVLKALKAREAMPPNMDRATPMKLRRFNK